MIESITVSYESLRNERGIETSTVPVNISAHVMIMTKGSGLAHLDMALNEREMELFNQLSEMLTERAWRELAV